jgi:multidrug efflux pump subunit AcrA (membrane-fusion protein)
MVAVLKINDYKADNAIVVPVNYVQTDPDGSFVYIAENKENKNIAKKAMIDQGQSYNGVVEITKGLKTGDKIVTSGFLNLESGEAISF